MIHINSTPTSLYLNASSIIQVDLAIIPFALTPGQVYRFALSTAYENSNFYSVASTVVTVNSPPTSGRFEVRPASGYALNTTYDILFHHILLD
jgi:hypothetical protein